MTGTKEKLASPRSLAILALALTACAILIAVTWGVLMNSFIPSGDTLLGHVVFSNDKCALEAAEKLSERDDAVRLIIERLARNEPEKQRGAAVHWLCLECWSTLFDGTKSRGWQGLALGIVAKKNEPAAVPYLQRFLNDPRKFNNLDKKQMRDTISKLCAAPPDEGGATRPKEKQ